MLNQGVPQVFMLTHYSTAFGCGVRQRKVLKYCTSGLFFILLHKKAVRTVLEPVTPCVTGMYSNQLN